MGVTRVVVASLLIGPVAAAALTVGVFAGAPEPVVTGSALLAFAAGWALLALLTTRLTTEPQRWAYVPAVLLAGTGLSLLVLEPGDRALTAAGWVWPPVLLVLAGWIAVMVRRALAGARRWLLYPVAALLVLAAAGGLVESVAQDRPPMPGRSYAVGGHELHLACAGTGGPTVLLNGGLGEASPAWDRIVPGVARATRVCAYDRAGQGWSGAAAAPQDAVDAAADLHALLAQAHEAGPYVLAGHSTGGTYAMAYAALYPADVAGLVLLDSAGPHQFTALPDYPAAYALLRRLSGLLPSLSRLGVVRLYDPASSPRDLRAQRDELSRLPDVFREAGALTTLGGRPLVVLTATRDMQAGWLAAQDQLALLSTGADHRLADVDHAGLLADPAGVEASVRAITDVVRAA